MPKKAVLASIILIFVLSGGGNSFASLPDSYEGARPMGMGGAFVAVADDPNAVFYNPAGLGFLKGTKIDLTYVIDNDISLLAEDLVISQFLGDYGCIGIGVCYERDYESAPSHAVIEISDSSSHFLLSYSKAINQSISFGVNYRTTARSILTNTVWHRWESEQAAGSGIDLGFLNKISDKLTAGIFASNLLNSGLTWDSGAKEAIYSKIKTGVAYKTLEDKLLLSIDINYQLDEASLNLGGEYEALEWLFLRGGYNSEQDRDGALSIGLGLKGGFCGLDLAYLSGNEKMNYVSLNINW